MDSYCESLEEAEALARNSELGVHGSSARVRTPQQAGEQFTLAELAKETEGKKIKVIIQYCFDGGRYKVEEVRWRCRVCVCVCFRHSHCSSFVGIVSIALLVHLARR